MMQDQQQRQADGQAEEEPYEIDVVLGSLSVSVSGHDKQWVAERFEEVWAERLKESEEIAQAVRDGMRGHH